jgi:hypothetical protein
VRAQAQAFPKRLVLFYNPNGSIPEAWSPAGADTQKEFALTPENLGEIHKPLAPFADRLLILGGIDLSVAELGPGGPHQRGIGSLYTGEQLQQGEFVDGCGKTAGWANGISVDQEVANVVSLDPAFGPTKFKSLELGVRATEADMQARISYAGPGLPLPPMNNPTDVWQRLFGEPLLIDPRKSVLDTVRAQFAALRSRVGAEDRGKLDQHLDFVKDLEIRVTGSAVAVNCTTPAKPDPTLEVSKADDMPRITTAQLDLLAHALACDLTRVASVQISTALNRILFPWIPRDPKAPMAYNWGMQEGHTLSHSADTDLGARAELVTHARWHAEQLAYFMNALNQFPEGSGTLLDNTLIVWGNEVSRGNTHSHVAMPLLVAGSLGGAIRTGRYVNFGPGMPHNRLLVSILNAMGIDTNAFGHPDFATGALSGLT